MMKLKRFNEFYDLGKTPVWGPGKVGLEVAAKVKPSVLSKLGYIGDYASGKKVEKTVTPKDLMKHDVKPLSDKPSHKEYTVHHLKGGGYYDTALLHHEKKGFVGMLNGKKKKDGFHVSESFISPTHRGKGLGVALYEHAANHHKGLVSDGALSVNSQRIYGHFAKQGRVTVHHDIGYEKTNYDSDHGEKVDATVITKKDGRSKKAFKALRFSSKTHENINRAGSGVKLRIEPQKKSKKA